VGHGDLFKVLDQFREEWIGDVFDNDAENAAAAGDQAACMGVGEVVELLDGLPDALGEPLTAGELLMVRETVAMETFARAATVRMSGVFVTGLLVAFRTTNPSSVRVESHGNALALTW
jgi:hypothetical protein